jgi:8-oxo-dGTP pyrophosphatase MutT (NUDIX family)
MDAPLLDALTTHVPRSLDEARDVERVRSLLGASPWDRGAPLHVTGSALIVHAATRRVLLRWHERQQAWLQVGGHGDPGEDDPFAIALREAEEETGLSDLVAFPDRARRAPVHLVIVPVPAGKGEPAHEHADIRYVLATEQPETARPESPSAPMRWLTLDEAFVLSAEENLHETLRRVAELLDTAHG